MSVLNYDINSFLSFKLGEELFAANVEKVLNILEMPKITKVPKAPVFMKGVINLRGSVLPVIDTRIKFNLEETEYTNNTCILVLDINMNDESVRVGAIVDSVQEVIELKENQIEPAPSIGNKFKSEFIEGVAKHNEDFIMLLNMDLVFSINELTEIKVKTEKTEVEAQEEDTSEN